MANGQMPGLAGLAQGLRLAGGILSPSAREANLDEDRLQQQQAQQMRLAQINQTVKGIEMGAIEPEAGRATLKQLGFDAPVGLSAEGQARMEKVRQQREMQAAIAKLPPDATAEQKMGAIYPYLPSEQQVKLYEIGTVKKQKLEQDLDRYTRELELKEREATRREDKDAYAAQIDAFKAETARQLANLKWVSTGSERAVSEVADLRAEALRQRIEDAKQKREDAAAKDRQRTEVIVRGADNVIAKVDEALKDVSWWRTGPTGAVISKVPGTTAYELSQVVETIKANIGFDRLQQMRDASPTGGALGQVAIQELVSLQASIASLDTRQGADRLKANLEQVKKHYENWRDAVRKSQGSQGPSQPPPALPGRQPVSVTGANETTEITRGGVPVPVGGGEIARVRSDADFEALPSGTEFIGPDGRRRRKP